MNNKEKRVWLKELRKEKGLTVREIAPLLETSFSHYSDIENGRRNPSVDLCLKMAKFYDVSVLLFIENRVNLKEKKIV